MEVEIRKTSDVKPYAKNPRKNDPAVDAVATSIKKFGFRQPIVVDDAGVIIVGHTRWKAAQKLAMPTVPVHVAKGMSETDAKAYRLADNRTNDIALWDWDVLPDELKDLKDAEFDLSVLGFNDEEIMRAVGGNADTGLCDADDVGAVPDNPITKPGDLWVLGDHRLLCGDSTNEADVARLMGGNKADLLLTDPPYGVDYVGKTKDAMKIQNDAMSPENLASFIGKVFDVATSACRAGAVWYATVPARPLHIIFASDWDRRGILRQILVWMKDSMVLGRSEYHYQHEPILFGWLPGGNRKVNKDRTRTSVWKYDRPKASREHPTMKPIGLWSQAIADGSVEADIVYDPFLGSGTSIIASEMLRRRCFGMEFSPKYCDVIVNRYEKFTGKKAKREKPTA